MEERLQLMTQQRNVMRSRESLAKANAVFERWELSISDTEIAGEAQHESITTKPALQRELEAQEEKAALNDELAALMANKG